MSTKHMHMNTKFNTKICGRGATVSWRGIHRSPKLTCTFTTPYQAHIHYIIHLTYMGNATYKYCETFTGQIPYFLHSFVCLVSALKSLYQQTKFATLNINRPRSNIT